MLMAEFNTVNLAPGDPSIKVREPIRRLRSISRNILEFIRLVRKLVFKASYKLYILNRYTIMS